MPRRRLQPASSLAPEGPDSPPTDPSWRTVLSGGCSAWRCYTPAVFCSLLISGIRDRCPRAVTPHRNRAPVRHTGAGAGLVPQG